MDAIVNSPVNRAQKSLVGVMSKIDDDLGSRSDGSRNFDIEHYLAIRSVGVAGRMVPSPADQYLPDFGHGYSPVREILNQIPTPEAPAEFNDTYTLT